MIGLGIYIVSVIISLISLSRILYIEYRSGNMYDITLGDISLSVLISLIPIFNTLISFICGYMALNTIVLFSKDSK